MGSYQCKPSADAILAQASPAQSGTAETARYEGVPKRRYLTLIQGNSGVETSRSQYMSCESKLLLSSCFHLKREDQEDHGLDFT